MLIEPMNSDVSEDLSAHACLPILKKQDYMYRTYESESFNFYIKTIVGLIQVI